MQNKSNLNSKPVMQRAEWCFADHVSVGQAAPEGCFDFPWPGGGPHDDSVFGHFSPSHPAADPLSVQRSVLASGLRQAWRESFLYYVCSLFLRLCCD